MKRMDGDVLLAVGEAVGEQSLLLCDGNSGETKIGIGTTAR